MDVCGKTTNDVVNIVRRCALRVLLNDKVFAVRAKYRTISNGVGHALQLEE